MHIVDVDLARRLELTQAWRGVNYARALHKLKPEIKVKVEPVGGGFMIFAGKDSPLNRAVGLGFQGPVPPPILDEVESFYQHRVSPIRVDLCPLAGLSLIELLSQRTYTIDEFKNILFISLDEDIPEPPHDPDIVIRQADSGEADLWIRTTAQGFEESASPSPETLQILLPNFHSENSVCFFAIVGDEPVGGGGMYLYESAVELGGASTLPAFRRKGIQTALLVARLKEARRRGCRLAIVVTSPGSGSQRNIERVGFRLAYTKATVKRVLPSEEIQ